MTLEDLRVFDAVCEAQSLSAVARRLDCTQPAVAQHVMRLERELGEALLERTAKGVVLTAAGRLLYQATATGLGALELARREIHRLRDGESGRLSIATGGTTVRHFMREAVIRFRQRHPDVTLHFEPANSTRHCLDAVARRTADMAFVTISGEQRGFEQRPALKMPLVLLVRHDDRLARRRAIGPCDLNAIRYIALPEYTASHGLIRDMIANHGATLRPTARVDDWDTANVFVELGLGHAIVPAVHARHFERAGLVRGIPIRGLPPVVVGWATRSFQLLPPVAVEFMDMLAAAAVKWVNVSGLTVIGAAGRSTRSSRQ